MNDTIRYNAYEFLLIKRSITTITLSFNALEIFDFQKYCNHEIMVEGHSRSLNWHHSIHHIWLYIHIL